MVLRVNDLPACIDTGSAGKQSKQIGWALDGFPIYGDRNVMCECPPLSAYED